IEEEQDGGESIGERNPAHELSAFAEEAAETEAEDGEEFRKGAGAAAEYDSETEVEDADAGIDCGLGSGFPLLTQVGKKAGTEAGGFVEELVAAIAVDADGRGDEEHLRRMPEASKGSGERKGGMDAALGDLALEFGSPAMVGEVRTRKMNGGGEVFKGLRSEERRVGEEC